MANANQSPSSGRQQGQPQPSEPGRATSASAQQGSHGNQPLDQQSARQSPRTGQQTSGAVRPHRGTWPASLSHFGAWGGGPLSMMRRISEDMEQLFESFGFGRGQFRSAFGDADTPRLGDAEGTESLWLPHIEVYEGDGKLVINAELPGVKKEDVDAEITTDAVTIRGTRKQERSSSEAGLYRSERSYGSFHRLIPLPEGVDPESATANFRDGVLRIEMRAPQRRAHGRTLQIGDSGPDTTLHASSGSESPPTAGGSQQHR
jgi:HSP20 family protein